MKSIVSQRPANRAGVVTAVDAAAEQGRTAGLGEGVVLCLCSCLPVMAFLLIAPNLLAIEQQFKTVPNIAVLAPIALTIPALMVAIFSPAAGILADRLGRKFVLVTSLIVYPLAGIAPAFLSSINAIIASRAVVGIAEAAIITCSTTLIGDFFSGERRERYVSAQAASTSIASILFLIIGGALGELGWRTTSWVYGLCVILIPATYFIIWNPQATQAISAPTSGDDGVEFPWVPMCGMWSLTFLASIAFFIVPVQTANLLMNIGIKQPAVFGLATAVGAISLSIGSASYAQLARCRFTLSLAGSLALLAIGLGLMATAYSLMGLMVGIVPAGLGAGFLLPVLLNWTMDRLTLRHRAKGVGSWYGTFFLGQFTSPLAILALASILGGLSSALVATGALCFLGAIGFLASDFILRGNR